jgi:hypothetical protein
VTQTGSHSGHDLARPFDTGFLLASLLGKTTLEATVNVRQR